MADVLMLTLLYKEHFIRTILKLKMHVSQVSLGTYVIASPSSNSWKNWQKDVLCVETKEVFVLKKKKQEIVIT